MTSDVKFSVKKIGTGGIGGKARVLKFLHQYLNIEELNKEFHPHRISIADITVVASDVFEQFIEKNSLYTDFSSFSDEQISKKFLESKFSSEIITSLRSFLEKNENPLAVRPSTLYEDDQSHQMVGYYKSILLPNNDPDMEVRLDQLTSALKLLYAQAFYLKARGYMKINKLPREGERVSAILQDVSGARHGRYFFPEISGVAQSLNFFPVGRQKVEDGMCSLAFGLGHAAVKGETVVRFSPCSPGIMPGSYSTRDKVLYSQKYCYVLDMEGKTDRSSNFFDNSVTLCKIQDAGAQNPHFNYLTSGYNESHNTITDSLLGGGTRLPTFTRILQQQHYPVPKMITRILSLGSVGFGAPVTMKFIVTLEKNEGKRSAHMRILVLRPQPIIQMDEGEGFFPKDLKKKELVLDSKKALGHGSVQNIKHIIFLPPEEFSQKASLKAVDEIALLNEKLGSENDPYMLLLPGRCGSRNPSLGVPVLFSQICNTSLVAEISSDKLSTEPSQGTHFFHNMVARQVKYLYIDTSRNDTLNNEWLMQQPVANPGGIVRHIVLDSPVTAVVDGKTSRGAVFISRPAPKKDQNKNSKDC